MMSTTITIQSNAAIVQPASSNDEQRYPSDLIVLLDIDLTMVDTHFFDTKEEAQAYADSLPTHQDTGKKVDFVQLVDREYIMHVNLRPGLSKFLEEVGRTFETHIFTAADIRYAKVIARLLDPHGHIFRDDRIWSKRDCTWSRNGKEHWKRLSKLSLGRDMNRIVLIDDNPCHLRANPGNVILIKDFTDDPEDTELDAVCDLLWKLKDSQVDVRPVLKRKFEMQLILADLFGW